MVADEAQAALGLEALAVEGDDARRFLPAVLQCVKGEVRVLGYLKSGCDYPKDTAFIAGTFAGVVLSRGHGVHWVRNRPTGLPA